MPALIRSLAFFGAVFCLFSSLTAVSVHAQTTPEITPPTLDQTAPPATPATTTPPTTTHHKKTHHTAKKHKTVKAAKTVKKSKGDTRVRTAQAHLINLKYYAGPADGLIGPKTRAAIRKFQHDHQLRVDGKLSKQTYNAILVADEGNPIPEAAVETPEIVQGGAMGVGTQNIPATAAPDFYATHPDFYGYYNQSYDNALLLGPSQTLSSRFARVDMTEDPAQQGLKRYNVLLNGLPLILVDGQPSVVGVSKTFAMGDEDVMIFTSYRDHDPVCAYMYNLLILSADGTQSREIHNCTRGFQAKLTNGSLFITFPEGDDGRAVGNTWRYEKGDLEKL